MSTSDRTVGGRRRGSLRDLHSGPRRTSARVREPGKPGQERIAVLDRAARTEHGCFHRVERSRPHRLDHQFVMPGNRRGDHEDRAGRLLHDLPRGLDAVQPRHHEVHEDRVGPVRGRHPHGLVPVLGDPGDGVARHRKDEPPEHLAGERQVVDDGNPHGSGFWYTSDRVSMPR